MEAEFDTLNFNYGRTISCQVISVLKGDILEHVYDNINNPP